MSRQANPAPLSPAAAPRPVRIGIFDSGVGGLSVMQAIRARLGKNRLELPLFDTPQFARDIEAAFEWMLQDRTQP